MSTDIQSASSPFEFVTGTTVREPIKGREDRYSPFEAPALAPISLESSEVKKHQEDTEDMLKALVNSWMDPATPQSVKDLILRHFFSRDVVLDTENRLGYDHRLVLLPEFELEGPAYERHQRVMEGSATPWEIDQHRADVGSMGAQLAMLRTVEQYRTEHEAPMFEAVDNLLGDDLDISEPKKLQIFELSSDFYRDEAINGLIMGFKRDRGTRKDGTTIKSRHTFVVRTDYQSGFDPTIRQAIQRSAAHGAGDRPNVNNPMRLKRVGELMGEIARVGATHDLVAASMTSAYVFDPSVKDKIIERDKAIDARRGTAAKSGLDLFESYFSQHAARPPRVRPDTNPRPRD